MDTLPLLGCDFSGNCLLAGLPESELEILKPCVRAASFERGEVLLRTGQRIDRVFFPRAGVISAVTVFEDGATVEMATIGAEGMAELNAVLGGETPSATYMFQVPGSAFFIDVATFRRLMQECVELRCRLLNYAQAFLAQVMQSVACNAVHSIQDRAARWLLTCDDRSHETPVPLTQQYLSEMLGVSRGMVNTIARTFQQAGYISYTRGAVTIRDRAGLERAACECYRMIRRAFEERSIQLKPGATCDG